MKTIDDNKRDEILSCIIDTPENLTNEDIDLILSDEELRELYNAAVLCKDSSLASGIKIPDVEEELARFKATRKTAVPKINWWKPVMRVAAIFAGVAVTTVVAVAVFAPRAFDFFAGHTDDDEIAEARDYSGKTESAPLGGGEVIEIVTDKDLEYDNVPLETIVEELASIYKVEVNWKTEHVKSLRLYVKIEQGKNVKEAVQVLEVFEQFEISLEGNKVIIK